jgi:hypothetical protein
MVVGGTSTRIVLAAGLLFGGLSGLLGGWGASESAQAALTVNFNLTTDQNGGGAVPADAATRIRNAINAAVAVYNEWSNYTKTINVYYNSGVATADGNYNGTIRFGAGSQYQNDLTAFHEVNHVMGCGTWGTWQSNVDNNAKLWLGANGIAMSEQYFPDNTLKADFHIHWVGSGPTQNVDMFREGVHIVGALRQDMGLSNGNLYDTLGDFSNNGTVGLEDHNFLMTNLHKDVSAFSPSQGFRRGDFNLDKVVNYADVVGFTKAYEDAHGVGSLQAALAAVPEPAAGSLLALGAAAIATQRRRFRRLAVRPTLVAAACALIAFAGGTAQAQWRYLDATSSNTGPSSAFLPGVNNTNQADDNLWATRSGLASSGNVFQSGDGDGENAPQIFTTITGLTPNSFYAVNVHFWDAFTWSIRSGFVSGNLTLYAAAADAAALGATAAPLSNTLTYQAGFAPTIQIEQDRTMYAGAIGTTKSNATGQITVYIDDLPSTIGVNQRTWYDGLSYQATTLQSLTLRVNTVTGALSLRNETGAPIDLKYYEIRSNSGAFDPIIWNSLDDQEGGDPIGTGWDEAGGSTANILSEYNFSGSRLMNPNSVAYLGKAYAGAMQDIAFFYSIPNQNTLTAGFVDYVTTPALLGDFNGDDVVDAADLAQWRGDMGVNDDSDADLDGDSDGDDFLIWQRQLGATATVAAAASAVPEPGAAVLAAAVMIALTQQARHRAPGRR